MTRRQKFADNFWGEDFCSTHGLDVLVKKLKDGRSITKDLEEFIKQRSKIEEDYGKALQRLLKNNAGQLEIGTMKIAWETLKKHTEEIANEHLEMASHFSERARELNAFGEMQRNTRKMEEDTVRRYCKKKVELHSKNTQNKKTYDNKCREMETITQNLQAAKMQGSNATEKNYVHAMNQVKTLMAKESKCKLDMEKADGIYREINVQLEQTRVNWEKEMSKLCESFEGLETDRFNHLQNEMWSYTNVMSQACVNIDDHCEKIRQAIEKCNKDADLDEFISQKTTGQIKPAKIPYRKYGEPEDRQLTMAGRPVPHAPLATRPPAVPPTR